MEVKMKQDFNQEVNGIVNRTSRLGSVDSVLTPPKKKPMPNSINININKRCKQHDY